MPNFTATDQFSNQIVDLTIKRAAGLPIDDDTAKNLIRGLSRRLGANRQQMDFLRTWCDRADALYFPTTFTDGGADLWPNDPSATTKGRSHVSLNEPSVYVDVPSALQAQPPIENMRATDTSDEARTAAGALERVYTAWKQEVEYELKFHQITTTKSLYGLTAARIYWDPDAADDGKGYPCVEVVDQPRNLWLGWKTDAYQELEWAAYCLRYEPNALAETFGVEVSIRDNGDGTKMPFVSTPPDLMLGGDTQAQQAKPWTDFGKSKIEVWDYWYRLPKPGAPGKFTTWNAVIAGTQVIQGPTEYPEYKGLIPYVVVFNTYVPGVPMGRPDLYDVEPLIREEMELITAGSQMIKNASAGDFWQLVGPEAPTRVPAGLKPKRNELVAPGPGNRIETITPFIAQFQLEQFLGRIDRSKAIVSGLNDLLLGLAPAQVLSSSKAINALIANFETRIAIRRKLLYAFRRRVWKLALQVWEAKSDTVKAIVGKGGGYLDITDPSLNPRDEMETATRVINLVNSKLMSVRTAMDLVGIDDPETEMDMIREERTDATMFPAEVQVMAQLLAALQSLGLTAPQGVQGQAQAQVASGTEGLRQALGAAAPTNSTSSQLPGDQGITPPIEGAGPNEGGTAAPFAAAQQPAILQGMVQNGEAKGRILTQQKLGRR